MHLKSAQETDYPYTVENGVSSPEHTEGLVWKGAGWHSAGGLAFWSRVLRARYLRHCQPCMFIEGSFSSSDSLLAPNPNISKLAVK